MLRTLLLAALAVPAVAQTWTLTDVGRQCGGDLAGQVQQSPTGQGLRLAVSNAQANALAILVVGHRAPAPIQLPGSACTLVVDPRHTMFATTDAQGSASFSMRLPTQVPMSFLLQVVTGTVSSTGRVLESTDGLRVDGV